MESMQQSDAVNNNEDIENTTYAVTKIEMAMSNDADESRNTEEDVQQNIVSNENETPMSFEPHESNETSENLASNNKNKASNAESNSLLQKIKTELLDSEINAAIEEIEMDMANETQESRDEVENVATNVPSSESEIAMDIEPQGGNDMVENLALNVENQIITNAAVSVVKQEPNNDEIPIDKQMPLAKDSSYINSNKFAVPIPTDDFLDGIATAVAPPRTLRLRVKSEFSLIPQKTTLETNLNSQTETDHLHIHDSSKEMPMPPPPPLLSSNSTSELCADGIATPRISLLALNRLKIKTESSQSDNNEESSILPAEFFEDLLKSNSTKETGELSASNSDTESEGIPQDFFDDLLPEQSENNELEVKYSVRLKEKENLQNASKASMEETKDKRRNHKKQKKSKKKLSKRSRSPAHKKAKKGERNYRNSSPTPYSKEIKRSRRLSPDNHDATTSSTNDKYLNELDMNNSLWVPETFIRVKQEFQDQNENKTEQVTTPLDNVEEVYEILTPKQKRERAIKRATALLSHLQNTSLSNNYITSTFSFVSTVRKLPTSHSYVQQHIYENRSPLHTINNVSYKFNSHATRFNMEEWGLAVLSTHAAKMAKLVGCDAEFIYEKLKTITIPAKLKKLKTNSQDQINEQDEEKLIENKSSLFCNAMTQTDEDTDFNTELKGKHYDIGVQAEPSVYSIGCQTLETPTTPTENLNKDDEAPIMNILRELNENQLMAIHSFAELVKEQMPSTNAMDIYKLQRKMMEIYKISQIPSALSTPQSSQISNSYTTTYSDPLQRRDLPIIQSVKGADGKQFSINDPRAKSLTYSGRIVNNCGNVGSGAHSSYSSSNSGIRPVVNDNRYYDNTHPRPLPHSTYRQHQQYHTGHQPPSTTTTTTKGYGRGAVRR